MGSETCSQITNIKEYLVKEYNHNILNALSESSTVIFRKIYDEKGKEIPFFELVSIEPPKTIPKRGTHLENKIGKNSLHKLNENAKSKGIWSPLEPKSRENLNHKNEIIVLEESDNNIKITSESKFPKTRGEKYNCNKGENEGKLKKEDKNDLKKRKMSSLLNEKENETKEEKKEKDMYGLKNQNINEGPHIIGKASLKTKENDCGEEFFKFFTMTSSNNDKNDNFLGKKRKKNKSLDQSTLREMEIIELSDEEEKLNNKKVPIQNNAQTFITGNKSSHFPKSKIDAILKKYEGNEYIIELEHSTIMSKSQKSMSLKENNNKDEGEYQFRIKEIMDRIDEKKKCFGPHYNKTKSGHIYKYRLCELSPDKTALMFKCYDEKCNSTGTLATGGLKFSIIKKHNIKYEDHIYFNSDIEIKKLKESKYSDIQIIEISKKLLSNMLF